MEEFYVCDVRSRQGAGKAYEDKSLKEILDASPAALASVTDADAKALQKAFNIKTVRQFGTNKFFAFAALV